MLPIILPFLLIPGSLIQMIVFWQWGLLSFSLYRPGLLNDCRVYLQVLIVHQNRIVRMYKIKDSLFSFAHPPGFHRLHFRRMRHIVKM